ncbi:alpha/beta hydrolase [Streptomyces camelliae]|uniref:Alpha/beta hydrolase-fold protein n=1 Tax=Streptomyces camelliae TaxID=3004093 RepID=A0ABY7NUH9_9ACTN|nr:alpha/beta hydrolase-fold protein [Streptomyces sp. HUAS 2-6]WBO61896.1 alpha/beta hydrolase-fold protein [Streptomyces sp. HUAS 2-6]
MSLTGTPFFVLLIVATAVCVAGTLVLWSRLRGPHSLRWLLRLMMIGLCQLTAISVVATWINNDYGLYASWDDLLGNANGAAVAMPGPPADRAKFTHGDSGMLDTYFRGKHSQLSGQVIVWTPPQYSQPRYRHTRFPVVLLLHGVPGSPASWLEHGGMPHDFQQLMNARTSHPFILAMPVVDPGGVDTDCTDQPNRKVATWMARDVPELISHTFRTLPGPKGWGVMGFSTGGFCAARLPLAYPKVFGVGAALDPDALTGDTGVIEDPVAREHTSPTYMVKRSTASVSLFLATSAEDRLSPPHYIEQFARDAAATRVQTQTMVLPDGGHNYNTWTRLYPAAFSFLSRHTTAPKG